MGIRYNSITSGYFKTTLPLVSDTGYTPKDFIQFSDLPPPEPRMRLIEFDATWRSGTFFGQFSGTCRHRSRGCGTSNLPRPGDQAHLSVNSPELAATGAADAAHRNDDTEVQWYFSPTRQVFFRLSG